MINRFDKPLDDKEKIKAEKHVPSRKIKKRDFFFFSLLNWRFIVTRRHYNKKYVIYGFDSWAM